MHIIIPSFCVDDNSPFLNPLFNDLTTNAPSCRQKNLNYWPFLLPRGSGGMGVEVVAMRVVMKTEQCVTANNIIVVMTTTTTTTTTLPTSAQGQSMRVGVAGAEWEGWGGGGGWVVGVGDGGWWWVETEAVM